MVTSSRGPRTVGSGGGGVCLVRSSYALGELHQLTPPGLWRKNRRENGSKLAYGVDLNRNFNAHWELDNGASRSPASEVHI